MRLLSLELDCFASSLGVDRVLCGALHLRIILSVDLGASVMGHVVHGLVFVQVPERRRRDAEDGDAASSYVCRRPGPWRVPVTQDGSRRMHQPQYSRGVVMTARSMLCCCSERALNMLE